VGYRILVLVPHPDDEVVGCAAALRRARQAGAELFALYLTTGVPAAEVGWPWLRSRHAQRVAQRRAEAEEAAQRLGIQPSLFCDWPSRELKAHLGEAHALIAARTAAVRAQALWTPAYEGGHQDHDVTNFLASRFAAELPVLEFTEYNAARGEVQAFPQATGAEQTLRLTADEAAWKADLLAVYRSERDNLAHLTRRGFACEVLRPLARHDYARPPHPGRLFYQRHQWVPFPHPRVDFTPPEAVAAAIAAFQPLETAASPLSLRVGGRST
jgi:N-acetylglucosamine malate deacetylase 1